jgi:predicted Zn-dependent peptidase
MNALYKPISLLFCAVLVGMPLATPTMAQIPPSPAKITYPPLKWKIPVGAPYRKTLANGLNLYIAEDHAFPLVNVSGYVRGGTLLDPAGKEGLGSLATSLLKTGGTKQIHADSLDALLERLALNVSFSISATQISFSASFLPQFTDTALALLSQMLFQPAFEKSKLEQSRTIFIQNIRHRFDNPEPVLSAAYNDAMYPGQAISRLATENSVKAISREDLIAYHARYFKSGAMLLAVSGDMQTDSMSRKLAALFPKANPADSAAVKFPTIAIQPPVKSLVVHKPTSQAYVRMGLPLFARPNPDYYAVSLLNLILGGNGFSSRLGSKIRSDEGLTYSIDSDAESVYFYPGTFNISFFTKNESLNQALTMILAEVKKMREQGVTDDELSGAKKVLIDGLPSSFRSPDDIVSTYAWNEYYGRSPDIFVKYPDEINALTKKDLAAVAQKYLTPDAFTYVVVGDTSQLFKTAGGDELSLKKLTPDTVTAPTALPGLFMKK